MKIARKVGNPLLVILLSALVALTTETLCFGQAQSGSKSLPKEQQAEKPSGKKQAAPSDSDGKNKAEPKTAPKLSRTQKEMLKVLQFEIEDPAPAVAGSKVKAVIKGEFIKRNYHSYSAAKKTSSQVQIPTKFDYASPEGLQPLFPVKEEGAEIHAEEDGSRSWQLAGKFTWTQEILIEKDAKPGQKKVTFKPRMQICDENGCRVPATYPGLEILVEVKDGEPVQYTRAIEQQLKAEQKVEVVDASTSDPTNAAQGGLFGLLIAAFLGAFLMLLTPCVFPMIPITVNFFLKQSEKVHHKPLVTASVYSGTIIILLTVAMLVFGKLVIYLAIDPWFNLVLGGVLIFFALSLFGMYEIELPSGLARFTSSREGQGGYLGAVFMALTFTITSFTCTGPFLGAMMAPVAALKPPDWHLALAALVYSVTFAAPFFVLALFPTLLKRLPKSGGWLNAIKVSMGFIELAAALKFLSNTDIIWNPGSPMLFNYDTVLCAWIALSVACGLYLIGAFRLPHDDETRQIGVVRMLFAALFFGLAIYMTPLLRGENPEGIVGDGIVAFLPPSFRHTDELPWHLQYKEAWEEWKMAKGEKKYIFIDFTGVTCSNCRANEKNVFARSNVQKHMKNYVLAQLYTDTVPIPELGAKKAKELAEKHFEWQEQLADITLPTYVIFRPNSDSPFKDGKLNGEVVGTTQGLITNVNTFMAFLERPLSETKIAKVNLNE